MLNTSCSYPRRYLRETNLDIGPAAFIKLVRCFTFRFVRAVHKFRDTFLSAT